MRGSLSRPRLLMVALVALVVAAFAVSAASATTGTTTANGFTVMALLSPDTVSKGQTVTQTASVKNVSASVENVRVRVISPAPSASATDFVVTLQPSATFARSISFPASLLKPGTHQLTVTALNRQTNTTAQATASITVN